MAMIIKQQRSNSNYFDKLKAFLFSGMYAVKLFDKQIKIKRYSTEYRFLFAANKIYNIKL